MPGHAREAHAVLGDGGHRVLQAFQVREIILAQRDEDAVVGAIEVEAFDDGIFGLEHQLERLRRAVFDEVRQVVDEFRGALAPEIVALPEREDFLELVEDEERRERVAGVVVQHVVAVVEEFPQRFAGNRRSPPRPLAQRLGRARANSRCARTPGRSLHA